MKEAKHLILVIGAIVLVVLVLHHHDHQDIAAFIKKENERIGQRTQAAIQAGEQSADKAEKEEEDKLSKESDSHLLSEYGWDKYTASVTDKYSWTK